MTDSDRPGAIHPKTDPERATLARLAAQLREAAQCKRCQGRGREDVQCPKCRTLVLVQNCDDCAGTGYVNAGRFTQDELQELRDLFLAALREAPDA